MQIAISKDTKEYFIIQQRVVQKLNAYSNQGHKTNKCRGDSYLESRRNGFPAQLSSDAHSLPMLSTKVIKIQDTISGLQNSSLPLDGSKELELSLSLCYYVTW